jgi:hypothetical protein
MRPLDVMIKALAAVDLGARYLAGNVYLSRTMLPDSLLANINVFCYASSILPLPASD